MQTKYMHRLDSSCQGVGSQVNIVLFGTKKNLIEPEVVFGKRKYERTLFVSFLKSVRGSFSDILTFPLLLSCYS